MKKIFTLFLLIIAFNASSQKLIGGNNILKTNLSADAINNYNLTFERSINRFISLSVNYKTMPLSKLPLNQLRNNSLITLQSILIILNLAIPLLHSKAVFI